MSTCALHIIAAAVETIGIYEEKFNNHPDPVTPSTSSLTFVENSPKPLQCVITGGNPPPHVVIYIGRRDITNYFHLQIIPKWVISW